MKYTIRVVSLTVLLASLLSAAETDEVKEKAIAEMRRIANAMKECPEAVQYQNECAVHYIGPPTNLEWDVVPSKTVRSPFQGIIEFALPMRSQGVDPSKQSKKVQQRCLDMAALAASAEGRSAVPQMHDGHYRYEFDLGNGAPELVKRLWVAKDKDNNDVISAAGNGDYCWTKMAREAATAPRLQ